MARTTPALVSAIMEVDATLIPDLTAFIRPASLLMTRIVDPNYDTTLAADLALLTEIETWLAAHFAAVMDPRRTGERTGPLFDQYQSKVDLGLKVTHYGQQAMLLDTSGALAALDNRTTRGLTGTPDLTWLGTPYTYPEETLLSGADE